MAGIRSDADLAAFLSAHKQRGGAGAAVVEFGTAWCTKCHEMFPAFYALSKKARARRDAARWHGALASSPAAASWQRIHATCSTGAAPEAGTRAHP